ncbi:hypothetical protein NQ315_007655 [Exocentrus adspersus]|uniref:CBM39 domain-containing protein n=1 Tax=Exocentrus adspersus TaxID=1586481 RepID=A0AAV8W8A1_9CUCU|nr:hypothetical protein NQ315_007655 [Exocentrus adspersus]
MKQISYFSFVLIHAFCQADVYVFPQPEIQVFSPAGFTVSLPDEEGVSLFAFHGNINKAMVNLEAGQFSKDILRKKNGKWVFEEKSTVLRKGDVIYFWMVVIKDGLGYRYDDGQFLVEDIVERQPNQPTTQSNPDDKTPLYSPVCLLALNLSNTVDQLREDVKLLKETNDILRAIVAKEDASARTMRFEGVLPPFDDAQYVVQTILEMKLGVNVRVLNAKREKDKSITFELDNLDDKIYVIRTAKEKLEKAKSKIILKY